MTEDERKLAAQRLERRLRELDSLRLKRISDPFALERAMKMFLVFIVLCFALSTVLIYLER